MACRVALVKRNDFADKHAHGPGVAYYVMHREQKDVLVVSQTNQSDSQERPTFQVE
jgi:hypothetical protein